jgi:ABC-2 type transport system permease protein
MMLNPTAIYTMWLREMKRYFRARSRVIGTLVTPMFILAFFGLGFRRLEMSGVPDDVDYINFLVPGIVGMMMLFISVNSGISVLWDKEFGFLKEIMVAPVGRISIVIGRIAGGATIAMFQGTSILLLSMIFGFRPISVWGFLLGIFFMLLLTTTFIGFGLIIASNMKDMQGFSLIMNFIIFPLVFLSGIFYPLDNLPWYIRILSYIDPLTYGIDGLRGAVIGVSKFPIWFDLSVMVVLAIFTVLLGAYFFEKSNAV